LAEAASVNAASDDFILTADAMNFEVLDGFVPAAANAEVTDQLPDLSAYEDGWTEQEEVEVQQSIESDPVWHSEDGELFEAVLVLEDGSAWGRLGPAGDWPEPTEEDDFGASLPDADELNELAHALAELDASGDRGATSLRLKTDGADPSYAVCRSVSCDGRSRLSYPFAPEYLIGQMSQQSTTGATSQTCTAAKIGPRVALTNAHCVYDSSNNIWTTSGCWDPGQMGLNHHPSAGTSSVPWSGTLARNPTDKNYDYAIIYLADRNNTVGRSWFGISWWNSSSSYDGKSVYVSQYPGY
jgi:hypothetical protein